MDDKRSLVILGLKPMLQAGSEGTLSIRVKKAMCQLCVALADHEYIDVEGGDNVITFLVKNLIAQDGETVSSSFNEKKFYANLALLNVKVFGFELSGFFWINYSFPCSDTILQSTLKKDN